MAGPAPSKGRELAVRLSGTLTAFLEGRIRGRDVARELRAIAEWCDGGAKPETPAKSEATTGIEREVFEYWCARLGKKNAKFTQDRRSKVRARLAEGRTLIEFKRAIDGISSSSFHRGENNGGREHTDLTLICRSGAKFEEFRDMAPAPLVSGSGDGAVDIDALERRAAEELKEGKTNAYNCTQDEIRRALETPPGEPRSARAAS